MRLLINYLLFIPIILASCNKEDGLNESNENREETEVNLIFDFTNFNQEELTDENFSEDFITDGYQIQIKGNVHPKYTSFSNVNLKEKLPVIVMGDIEVTVSHPDFDSDALSTKAYFGTEYDKYNTNETTNIRIELEVVQGAVLITAPESLDNVLTEVEIMGKSSLLDVMYYTASEMVTISIASTQGDLSDEYANMLGESKIYELNSIEEGLVTHEYN